MSKRNELVQERFKELEEFIIRTGGKPSHKTDRSLYVFLHTQISPENKNLVNLAKAQQILNKYNLNKITYKSFDENYEEVRLFLEENKVRPTIKTNVRLVSFIDGQLSKNNDNIKNKNKIEKLLESYDFKKRTNKSFEDNYNALEAFIIENKKRPTKKTNMSLYRFVSYQLSKSNENLENKSKVKALLKEHSLIK